MGLSKTFSLNNTSTQVMAKQLVPRKGERKRFVGEATVRPLADSVPLPVSVLDMGDCGLSVFATRSLPKGTLVEVSFPVQGPALQAGLDKREGRIVRGAANADGSVMGIALSRPWEEHELKSLLTHWVRN